MKFIFLASIIAGLFLFAGNSNARPNPVTTLALTNEYIYLGSPWISCVTEDDVDQRTFSGALYGNYSTSFNFCDLSRDGWTSGGEGIQTKIGIKGALGDLTITSPSGTVTHAVYLNTNKHINYYEACVCPQYYYSNDTSGAPLMGGTWTITLSGQLSSVNWTVQNNMTDVYFQKQNCPASQQNII